MIRKLSYLLPAIFLILSNTAVFADNNFSLNDLYHIALNKSESIKQSEEDLNIAKLDKKRALSALIPDINLFGEYKKTKEEQTSESTPDDPLLVNSAKPTIDSSTWGVSISQGFTVNGKEITALKASEDQIAIAGFNLKAEQQNYLYKIAEAYYGILRAEKVSEIYNANVKRLEKHLASVNARLKLGEVTKTDLFRTEADLSSALSDLENAKNNFVLAKESLKTLVELPDEFTLVNPEEIDINKSEVEDLEDLLITGLNSRPEEKAAVKNYQLSQKLLKMTNGAYWPSLSITAKYTDNSTDSDGKYDGIAIDYGVDTEDYSVGLNLSFTLYDGGLRKSERLQALSKLKQAELTTSALKKNINLEIKQEWLNIKSLKSKIKSFSDKLKYSKENYRLVSKSFSLGASDSVDMMDANTLLHSSARKLTEAEYEYRLSLLKLDLVTGRFLQKNVN